MAEGCIHISDSDLAVAITTSKSTVAPFPNRKQPHRRNSVRAPAAGEDASAVPSRQPPRSSEPRFTTRIQPPPPPSPRNDISSEVVGRNRGHGGPRTTSQRRSAVWTGVGILVPSHRHGAGWVRAGAELRAGAKRALSRCGCSRAPRAGGKVRPPRRPARGRSADRVSGIPGWGRTRGRVLMRAWASPRGQDSLEISDPGFLVSRTPSTRSLRSHNACVNATSLLGTSSTASMRCVSNGAMS